MQITSRLADVRDQECPERNVTCWHPMSVPMKDVGEWTAAHRDKAMSCSVCGACVDMLYVHVRCIQPSPMLLVSMVS